MLQGSVDADHIAQLHARERLAAMHLCLVQEREGRGSAAHLAAESAYDRAFKDLADAREEVFASPPKNWGDVIVLVECVRASLLWGKNKPLCCDPEEPEYQSFDWRAVGELVTAVLAVAGRNLEFDPDAQETYDIAHRLIDIGPDGNPDLYARYLERVGASGSLREVAHV